MNTTETDHYLPIHREAPSFVEQATEQQILATGIKVLWFVYLLLQSSLIVQLILSVWSQIMFSVSMLVTGR